MNAGKKPLLQQFTLDAFERFGGLFIHLFGEAEVGYADDVVAADFRRVRLQLLVGKIHVAQGFKDTVKIDLALALNIIPNSILALALPLVLIPILAG